MTNASWETLSNQAIAVCGVVYFLALLSHLVEGRRRAGCRSRWARSRWPPLRVDERRRHQPGDGGARRAEVDEDAERRTNLFGRLGLLLTVIAVAVHFVGLLGRGMAADPNRVPWGNMYEFTISGSFCVALLYLVLYRKLSLGLDGPDRHRPACWCC